MKTTLWATGAIAALGIVAASAVITILSVRDDGGDHDSPEAMSNSDVVAALTQDANTPALLADLAMGKVDAIMDRIASTPRPCAAPTAVKGSTEVCPEGVAEGTLLPMFDVGPGDFQFWVTEATLRQTLEVAVPGGLKLGYAGRADSGRELFIGMDGAPKGKGVPPISSSDTDLIGVFLRYDPRHDQVSKIWPIAAPSSASQAGFVIAAGIPQEVIFVRTSSE